MKNINSSDGLAEDLIRSFIQLAVAEQHIKTLIEKRVSELENGIINTQDTEELNKNFEATKDLRTDLEVYAEARRADMRFLYELYGGRGNKEMWCLVKHGAVAMYTAFEAYQASEMDEELLDMALNKNRLFIKALSRFLGVSVTECAACFADILKGGR